MKLVVNNPKKSKAFTPVVVNFTLTIEKEVELRELLKIHNELDNQDTPDLYYFPVVSDLIKNITKEL
jgi:hypothetical protein